MDPIVAGGMSDYGDDYEDDDYGDEFDDDEPELAPAIKQASPKKAEAPKTTDPLALEQDSLLLPLIAVNKRNPKPANRKKLQAYLGNLDERVSSSLAVKSHKTGQRKWRTAPLDCHYPLGANLSRNGIFKQQLRTTVVRPLLPSKTS